MGVGEWFKEFCSEIQVKNDTTISLRYHALTRRLNTDFWDTTSDTSHGLLVGSYGRNTAINGFSDLDILFQLPYAMYQQYNAYSGNGQSALLQAVRNSIKKTYSDSSVSADGQVIQIPFTDGMTVEVVPAFINDDNSYTYPNANSGGSWQKTDPRAEIAAIRARNAACDGNLIPLCRMMRSWKNKWGVPVGGLLIDTLAYQFIENWPHRDKSFLYYDFMCRDFFLFMANQSETQEWWRAPGSAAWVWGKGLFQYKAKRCYNISLTAIAHQTKDENWSAKYEWRNIFGTAFPD
jgi:hypothetical protein